MKNKKPLKSSPVSSPSPFLSSFPQKRESRAKKSLGQHFLHNVSILQKITDAVNISDADTIVEVGGGHGELTELLKSRNPTKLIVIEKDEELALFLQKNFCDVQIISGDALRVLSSLELPTNWKLVGNIPYYITGQLLRIISELLAPPDRTVLLLQKEVAKRASAIPPDANLLSSMIRGWATPEYLFTVPRLNFHPAPKVDSATLLLLKSSSSAPKSYFSVVRMLFKQPRKKAINNLIDTLGITRLQAENIFSACSLSPLLRPQNLSPENILSITNYLDNLN